MVSKFNVGDRVTLARPCPIRDRWGIPEEYFNAAGLVVDIDDQWHRAGPTYRVVMDKVPYRGSGRTLSSGAVYHWNTTGDMLELEPGPW